MKKIYSAILIVFCISFAVNAGLNMDNRWKENGVLIAKGENWEAQFSKKEKGLFLRVWRENVEQSIMILPLGQGDNLTADGLTDLKLMNGDGKKIVIDATFHGKGKEIKCRFSFIDNGIAEITPLENMEGVRIKGDIRYAFLPGFFLEDIIYDPAKENGFSKICVPSENCIAGLSGDGNGILLCAWAEGRQQTKILLEKKEGRNCIQGIEIMLDGKSLYAGLLTGKDIWYQASFPDECGNDIKIPWKKPLDSNVKWRTQMLVTARETSFLFDCKKREGKTYNPVLGPPILYPLWFNENGEACFIFSEKISPKEKRAFIYPFEGHPDTVMGFLNRTPLGKYFTGIMKKEGPFILPDSHVPFVGFPACWGTELLRGSIIKTGIQDREQVFLDEWIKSVLNHNEGTQYRRGNYGKLINGMNEKITSWMADEKDADTLKFLEQMKSMGLKCQNAYNDLIKKDGYSSPDEYVAYAEKMGARLREIVACPGTELFPEYDDLIRRLNGVAWAQQESIGGFGWCLREWFTMAGYECRNNPAAIKYAGEIRKNIRVFLKARSWETMGL